MTQMFRIEGARPLSGSVKISGSKNASLPLLAATLLSSEITVLENVPDLVDTGNMCTLLEYLGAKVTRDADRVIVDPSGFTGTEVSYELMSCMRASYYALAPLLARHQTAKVHDPGGCVIGARPIDIHLNGFKALGAPHVDGAGYYKLRAADGLKGTTLSVAGSAGPSVGATCNIMMAAVLAEGTTIIQDAAQEPEIIELALFLNSMGAHVSGAGEATIVIEGVPKLHGTRWQVGFDRIEAATWAIAALVTHGDVTLEGVTREALGVILNELDQWGAQLDWTTDTNLRVRRGKGTKKPLTIVTEPFPGFPTDVQAQLAVLLALTPGDSMIRDTIFPERFLYVDYLVKGFGARIERLAKGQIRLSGVPALRGAVAESSDLRAGAALVLAALAAYGTSEITGLDKIDRGYERMDEKLRALGAYIERLPARVASPEIIRLASSEAVALEK
jgi:UDP-N-acetylglucosamine 1-carboxyvinyltransferase